MQRRSRNSSSPGSTARPNARIIRILGFSAVVLIILNSILILYQRYDSFKKRPSADQIRQVRSSVFDIIRQYGIKDEWIKPVDDGFVITIPAKMRFYQMYGDINTEVQKYNAQVCSCAADLKHKIRTLEIGFDTVSVIRIDFSYKNDLPLSSPRVAIIIDDFGYSFDKITQGFINMRKKLTLSIIPGHKYSERVAREAYHNGKEVMIHLPMEPVQESVEDLGYTIFTSQSNAEIRNRIRHAIGDVPFAKGLNNHKGSKATSDLSTMEPVLEEIKKAGLYFIDSRTSAQTLASKESRNVGVPYAERDIFIDVEDDVDHTKESLKELCAIASKNGEAIGIGHVKKRTLFALSEFFAEMEGKGIDFVFVSEIIR